MKKIYMMLLAIPLLLLSAIPVSADTEEEAGPRILKDEIIYNVLVDRFNNGRQAPSDQVDLDDPLAYQGGDIKGITDKLDDIKENGFTAIAVSPIMENADEGYHGYWVEDFYKVEKEFGDMDDLKTLVDAAHDRDMKIILELDLNYVAKSNDLANDTDKNDWFQEPDVTPIPATEWLHEVVQFDQSKPEVQDYLTDVAMYWMDEVEIDGFNFHAADQMDADFLEGLVEQIKEKSILFYTLATTLQGNEEVDYLREMKGVDAVSNHQLFEVMNEVITQVDSPPSEMFDLHKNFSDGKNLLYLDNMNTMRFSNNAAEHERIALTTWNIALGYLYFTPGTPMIFQGSEVPQYGPGFPENQMLTDFNSADPELQDVFSKMSAIRQQYKPLSRGDFEEVATDGGMSLFKRTYDGETVYVAINNDSESRSVEITGEALNENVELRGMLHDDTIRETDDGTFIIGMPRESSEVFVIKPNVGFNWVFIGLIVGIMATFVFGVIFLQIRQRRRERKEQD